MEEKKEDAGNLSPEVEALSYVNLQVSGGSTRELTSPTLDAYPTDN